MILRKDEYARRRRQLMKTMGKGAIAILPAAPERQRNSDVHYHYRPDSDFHYLTGFSEPEAVAVLIPGRGAGRIHPVRARSRPRARDLGRPPRRARGRGARLRRRRRVPDRRHRRHPAGAARALRARLLLDGRSTRTSTSAWSAGSTRCKGQSKNGIHSPQEFVALDHPLHDMRLYKSRAEAAVMRRSAQIAVGAHVRAMRTTRPGRHRVPGDGRAAARVPPPQRRHLLSPDRRRRRERLHPALPRERGRAAGRRPAADRRRLRVRPVRLRHHAHVSRSTAASRRSSGPSTRSCSRRRRRRSRTIKPGSHWNEPHDAAVRAITQGLVRLGLLKGRVPTLIKEEAYRKFYMHRTGHWLGMDVHDVGEYKVGNEWRVLEPGMVHDGRAGHLHPGGHQGRAEALVEHRRAHRGRRPRHGRAATSC